MDFNQSYAEFCNTIWIYFEQGRYGNRKSATYHVWTQQSPAARALMRQYLESNGARSFPDEPLVRAIYNGTGGLYTRREAELYGMEIKGDFC